MKVSILLFQSIPYHKIYVRLLLSLPPFLQPNYSAELAFLIGNYAQCAWMKFYLERIAYHQIQPCAKTRNKEAIQKDGFFV